MASTTNKAGFTLVELMIVVAIIGSLAAIAIPTMKSYQSRAKTAEAKLVLGTLHTALIAFRADFDSYASCLEFIGVPDPSVDNNNYYTVGFNADATNPNTFSQGQGAAGCLAGADFEYSSTRSIAGQPLINSINLATALVEDNGAGNAAMAFTAAAEGHIQNADRDTWSIDQDKRIAHIISGF
jgi:prepilin-type N-terminal cleavage/methylation domain-containing protein